MPRAKKSKDPGDGYRGNCRGVRVIPPSVNDLAKRRGLLERLGSQLSLSLDDRQQVIKWAYAIRKVEQRLKVKNV